MSNEKKNQDKAKAKDVVAVTDDGLAAKVRKLEDAVKGLNHFKQHILEFAGKMGFNLPNDGSARMGVLISIAATALAAVVMAETVNFPIFDQQSLTYGTANFSGNSSTKKAALSVDSVAVSNITAQGTITKGAGSGPFSGMPLDSYATTAFVAMDDFVNCDGLAANTLNGYVVGTNDGVNASLDVRGVGGELMIIPSTNNTIGTSIVAVTWGDTAKIGPFSIGNGTGKKFAYEARVKLADTNFAGAAFIGLCTTSAVCTDISMLNPVTGVLGATNTDWIGFWYQGTGTVRTIKFGSCMTASNAVTLTSSLATPSESYVRLGMNFDGSSTLTLYVDGVPSSTTVTWTNTTRPDAINFTPRFVYSTMTRTVNVPGGTGLIVDYWKAIQDR